MTTVKDGGAGAASAQTGTQDRSWVLPTILVLLTVFAANINMLSWYPVMPAMVEDWGITLAGMGLYTGLMGFVMILVSTPYGELTSRIGAKRAILITQFLAIAGAATIALSPNLTVGLIGRVIASAGFIGTQVPALGALGLIAPKSFRASMMGILTITGSAALIFGQQLFGARIGAAMGWQATHWAMAILTVVVMILFALFYHPKPAEQTAGTQARVEDSGEGDSAPEAAVVQDPSVYKDPQVWLLSLGAQMSVLCGTAVSVFVPLALASQFGMDEQGLATIASYGAILSVPFILGGAWLSDKLGTRKWVALGFIGLTMLAALGLNFNSATLFTVFAVTLGAVCSTAYGVLNAAFPEIHPHRNVAVAYGLSATVGGIFGYLVPQGLGILADATSGFTVGWSALAGLTLIAGILVALVKVR